MSYLHAEKSRYHDPDYLENSEEENLVHCRTVFPAIFLYEDIIQKFNTQQLTI